MRKNILGAVAAAALMICPASFASARQFGHPLTAEENDAWIIQSFTAPPLVSVTNISGIDSVTNISGIDTDHAHFEGGHYVLADVERACRAVLSLRERIIARRKICKRRRRKMSSVSVIVSMPIGSRLISPSMRAPTVYEEGFP